MPESALRVRKAAADHGLRLPLSVKSDILAAGGRGSGSLRRALARMQRRFINDYKYCNRDRLDEFDVHFIVLAPAEDAAGNPLDVPTATNAIREPGTRYAPLSGRNLFKREIEILNRYFVMEFINEDGNWVRTPVSRDGQTVRFRYKSHHYLADVEHLDEPLLDYGRPDYNEVTSYGDPSEDNFWNTGSGFYADEFHSRVWACNDRRLVDPLAINVLIIDKWIPDLASGTLVDRTESSASENAHPDHDDRFRPFILLDYTRILHTTQAEEHEMGHVFNLPHNADPDVDNFNDRAAACGDLHSNIMQGSRSRCEEDDPPSENGYRDIGFGVVYHRQGHKSSSGDWVSHCGGPFDQVEEIMRMARKLQANWRRVYIARWPRS